jgi:2-keto-4-pentenoate hydratase/2-oxohepta-3-ene-1,7-dioic acid hydratase in catechol pathway
VVWLPERSVLFTGDLLFSERLATAADRARHDPADVVDLAHVTLRAPVPAPPSIRDFMAFEEHVVNSRARAKATIDPDWYELPVFYFTNPATVHGPTQDVAVPPGCSWFDYELEVAAVVGRGGSNLTPDRAEAHIAGYTIMCDWSARDLQAREMTQRLGPAKGKDSATTLGPWLVTPDELVDRRSGLGFDLRMTASVNGRQYTEGNWSTVYWSFAQMLAYASRGTALRPGDVFGSGTVGRGCILELSGLFGEAEYPWLLPGDHVRDCKNNGVTP